MIDALTGQGIDVRHACRTLGTVEEGRTRLSASKSVLGAYARVVPSTTERYVPASGRAWLTGSYDRTVALSMRERSWRPALVRAAASELPTGARAVDVGCGTGSLTIALAEERPDVEVIGVDGDEAVLALACRKRGAERVTWLEGLASSLPVASASAHAVLCSLVLHHLSDVSKAIALAQIRDVLAVGGVLFVADWGRPRGPAGALGARALQVFDGREGPKSLLAGELPKLLIAAGFSAVSRWGALRTVWGTLELWRTQRGTITNGARPA